MAEVPEPLEVEIAYERKEFIRSFVLQVMLGVEGSYTRQYLQAVVSDAIYTWDLIERS